MRPVLYPIVIALLTCGCSLSDVGETAVRIDPKPEASDMAQVHSAVNTAFRSLGLPGRPEISDIHRNRGPFLSDWAMCMRNDATEKRQYYTFFFKDRKVTEHRLSVIVDGCETETYRRVP